MNIRNLFLTAIILTALLFGCRIQRDRRPDNNVTTYLVSGTMMELRNYCGGARPSEEILHPKPIATGRIKLFIRKSSTNETSQPIIDSIVSAADGTFSIRLAPGTYCFVERKKKDAMVMPQDDKFNTYDPECYKKEYATCDFSIEVKTDVAKTEIVLERHCPWRTPCVNYHGPLPPSAPPGNRGGNQPGHQE